MTLDWMLDHMEVAVMRHGIQVRSSTRGTRWTHSRARDETLTEYVGRVDQGAEAVRAEVSGAPNCDRPPGQEHEGR